MYVWIEDRTSKPSIGLQIFRRPNNPMYIFLRNTMLGTMHSAFWLSVSKIQRCLSGFLRQICKDVQAFDILSMCKPKAMIATFVWPMHNFWLYRQASHHFFIINYPSRFTRQTQELYCRLAVQHPPGTVYTRCPTSQPPGDGRACPGPPAPHPCLWAGECGSASTRRGVDFVRPPAMEPHP